MIRARIEGKYTLTAVDKRTFFREKLLERIREQIGTDNMNHAIKEQVLLDVCAKITAVYVGCFETTEQYLGEEVWAYKVEPERFYSMSETERERCKLLSAIWEECKVSIRSLGNNVIDDIIHILNQVDFIPKKGVSILAQARWREKKRLEQQEEGEQDE